jgi:hypothetical protein
MTTGMAAGMRTGMRTGMTSRSRKERDDVDGAGSAIQDANLPCIVVLAD